MTLGVALYRLSQIGMLSESTEGESPPFNTRLRVSNYTRDSIVSVFSDALKSLCAHMCVLVSSNEGEREAWRSP